MTQQLALTLMLAPLLCSPVLLPARVSTQSTGTVQISSLDLAPIVQGYGIPHANQSVDGHPLRIGGHPCVTGLGTHSVGVTEIDLKGGSSRFHAVVGVDDETAGKGSMDFRVLGDGRLLWTSGVMHGGDPGKPVDVAVTGVQKLVLLVGDADDGFGYDHADWAEATLTVTGTQPRTVPVSPGADPVICGGDAPLNTQRITSAGIVGSASGTPLLYAVTAAGMTPSRYEVQNLPAGLCVDPKTGLISGSITTPGDCLAQVRAAGGGKKASRTVRFVAGGSSPLTPPLGWNSYDGYGDNVTEAEVMSNAQAVAASLKPHGWQCIVVDYRWYGPGAHDNNANGRAGAVLTMDQNERLLPAPNRFPSAVGGAGFKPLADRLHAMGLKFGIHIMRGIPRNAVAASLPIAGSAFTAKDAYSPDNSCGWCPDMYTVRADTPAGQAWYDSIFRLYASWGLDFVKVDDLSSPFHSAEVAAIRRAINKCGREIVFSTSPGPAPIENATQLNQDANQWRITDDFWDNWSSLAQNFEHGAAWTGHGGPGHGGPGHWPDADMLPLGHLSVGGRSVGSDRETSFTKAEQVTLLTYDALLPSPLMLGGDFTRASPFEIALLTNDEVLAINQDPLGRQGRRALSRDGVQVWTKALQDGSTAVGLLNLLPVERPITITLADLGLSRARYAVRDVWQQKDLPEAQQTLDALVRRMALFY